MHLQRSCVLALAAALILAPRMTSKAEATPITYAFAVTGTTGPLAGTQATATVTYDSSEVILDGRRDDPNLFTDLSFTWDGILYNMPTAPGTLKWDSFGNPTLFFFGSSCAAPPNGYTYCGLTSGTEGWWLGVNTLYGNDFQYTVPSSKYDIFSGSVTMTNPIPEPASLTLLALGIVSVAARRLRQRN